MFTQQLPFSPKDPSILLHRIPPKLRQRGCNSLVNFSRHQRQTHSIDWDRLDYRLQKDLLSGLREKCVLSIVDASPNFILNCLKGSIFLLAYHYLETKIFLLIIAQRDPCQIKNQAPHSAVGVGATQDVNFVLITAFSK